MPRLCWTCEVVVLTALAMSPTIARGQDESRDEQLVQSVANRLIAVATPVEGWEWPPEVQVTPSKEVNAYASIDVLKIDGKSVIQPQIHVHQGYLDTIVQGDENILAGLLGHELAHILLRHVETVNPGSPLVATAISRQHELEADILGVKLALRAGFPYRGVVEDWVRSRENNNYTSFEGLNATHPSPTERLAAVDSEAEQLWYATSAFEDGVFFLMSQRYDAAEQCFAQVTRDFPKCYEAWANLGYAQLMRYCDSFTAEDLKKLDLGQLVVGGFYRRPATLESQRLVDLDLWYDAVDSLNKAIEIQPDLILVKSHLAVAYLVKPDGKDVDQSARLFAEVMTALEKGELEHDIDALGQAAIFANAAVSEIAAGRRDAADRMFDRAQEALSSANLRGPTPVDHAIRYNRATMLAGSDEGESRRSAIEQLEKYLAGSSAAIAWWPLAYERYTALCAAEGMEAKSQEQIAQARNDRFRLVSDVTLSGGQQLALNALVDDMVAALGEGVAIEVVRNSNVHRRKYEELGLDVLGTDRVLAIGLKGENAPSVKLQALGLAGESRELRIGMTADELQAALGADAEFSDQRYGMNSAAIYRYYWRVGVGVRVVDGKLTEMIVAQLPQERKR